MVKRTLAAGAVLLSSMLGAPAALASASPAPNVQTMVTCVSTGYSSMSRASAVARGNSWVTAKVPYSQTACHTDYYGHNYRTDCSGFVSMAWGLNASYVTSTLPSVSTKISYSSLQPGDMLDLTSQHAVLFVGFTDSTHTYGNFYQEGSTASGTYASTVSMSYWSSHGYGAYRYNHITN